jgi:hypothetical protein
MKKSNRKSNSTKRRVAYSLAAGAATAAVGINAAPADAAIQYSGLYNLGINKYNSLNWDLDYGTGPLSQDVKFKNFVYSGQPFLGIDSLYGKLVVSNASFPYYVSALSSGDSIGPANISPVAFQGTLASSGLNDEFENVDNAFIGLSWPDFGPTYYGWIRVKIDRVNSTYLVKDWAYDDSGAAILAGNTGQGFVPEPGTLGLLAAGSAGVLAMRRRRKAA